MSLEQVRREVYNLACDLRCLERTVNSEAFRRAYESADSSHQVTLETLILGCMNDDARLRTDCTDTLKSEIRRLNMADWTIRDLRERAYQLGVKGYSRMDKDSLLSAIITKESHAKDRESSHRVEANIAGSGA
jgi:hypothetical protein